MIIESPKHYYNLIKKVLYQKKIEISDLEIATEKIFSYYQYEPILKKLGFKSPTQTMYLLIRDSTDINEIIEIITDFLKMYPEIVMILKDRENATLNYNLDLVYKYLYDEYFEKRKINWSAIYNYDDKFIKYINSLSCKSGVYFIFNQKKELIYIGKSKDLSERIFSSISERLKYHPYYISILETENICDANILEPFFISQFKPIANTEFNEELNTNIEILIKGEKLNYLDILTVTKIKIFSEYTTQNTDFEKR